MGARARAPLLVGAADLTLPLPLFGSSPLLVGAADLTLLKACSEMRVPAAGIIPELDVWTYQVHFC